MSIIRNINSITDLKRGAVDINFVYRGTALVWQRGIVSITRWLTSGINTVLSSDSAGTNSYITSGINTKFK